MTSPADQISPSTPSEKRQLDDQPELEAQFAAEGDSSVADKDVLGAVIAEYNQMRAEIGRCQDHQKDMMNLAFVVLGAMLAFIGVVANQPAENRQFAVLLLLVPVLYALLAFTCADRARRMLDLAHYVQDDLRVQGEKPADGRRFWRWEEYKHARYEELSKSRRALALILDKARWLVFCVPSVLAIVAYASLVGFDEWRDFLWLGLDALLLVTAFYVLLLADETRGLPLARELRKSGPIVARTVAGPPQMRLKGSGRASAT